MHTWRSHKQYLFLGLLMALLLPVHSQDCSDLFISEYIEGSSWNKAIELYNSAPVKIGLEQYTVHYYTNGDTTPSYSLTPAPGDTLYPGDVYVIAHTSATLFDSTVVDTFYGASFNGDDAIGLYRDSTLLDQVGEIGTDPGNSWPVGTGSTEDNTLVRKDTVRQGQTDWSIGATEWEVYSQDQDSLLGWHHSNCVSSPPVAGFQASFRRICRGSSVRFRDTSQNYASQRIWIFEQGQPDTTRTPSPTVTYDTAGDFDVTLIVTNSQGSDTLTKNNWLHVASPQGLALSGDVQDVRCHGQQNGQITTQVQGGTAPFRFQWSSGDTSQSIDSLSTGVYRVTVSDSNKCRVNDSFQINEPPLLQLSTGSQAATEANNDGKAWVTVQGGTPPYSYRWNDSLQQQNDTATRLYAGPYEVAVSDTNNCRDTGFVLVAEKLVDHLNPLAPSAVRIYPNPVRDKMWVRVPRLPSGRYQVSILRPDGTILQETIREESPTGPTTIVTTHLSAGLYFLRIKIGQQMIIRKFQVLR